MQNDLTTRLAELVELDEKRTQGEWRQSYSDGSGPDMVVTVADDLDDVVPICSTAWWNQYCSDEDVTLSMRANAAFIAAAPSAVALAKELHAVTVAQAEVISKLVEALELAKPHVGFWVMGENEACRAIESALTFAAERAAGIGEPS